MTEGAKKILATIRYATISSVDERELTIRPITAPAKVTISVSQNQSLTKRLKRSLRR